MGKYRIKSVKYRDYSIHDEGDIRSIDIIELEPLDQESDICNKDKPKEETLEEKFYNHLKSGFLRFYNSEDKEVQKETARRSAKIAKEYYQEHPENINCIKKSEAIRQMIANNKKLMKGMVSHAEVLKVFDEASSTGIMVHRDKETTSITYPIAQIRKALEDISC